MVERKTRQDLIVFAILCAAAVLGSMFIFNEVSNG